MIDLRLGAEDGLALAAELGPDLPVFLLAQKGFRLQDVAQKTANVVGSVSKPIRRSALWEALRARFTAAEKPAVSPASETATRPGDAMPLRILLAEDNVINQKVAIRLLDQLGYRADIANNGQEAVDAATNSAYDLVFMDIQMPLLDGLEATEKIRALEERLGSARARHSVIIALTANAVLGDRERCLQAGMDDYLPKPVRPHSLREMVDEMGDENFGSTCRAARN